MPPNLISVIVPCFNAERTLAQALNSIPLSSASQPVEVIVVDDGSTDRSAAIVEEIRPCSILVTQANQGVSSARNYGISIAKGDWIQFLDADDVLLPQTLEHRLRFAHQSYSDAVITDWIPFTDRTEKLLSLLQRPSDLASICQSADWQAFQTVGAEISCATSFWAPPAAVLYKRSIVKKIGAFRNDLSIVQDHRFLFDAAVHGAKFEHLPEPGALYRISSNSLSRKNKTLFYLDCLRNGQQIEQLWSQRDASLSDAHNAALQQIFSVSTQGLLLNGHSSAFLAAKSLCTRGGQLSFEERFGLQLLRCTGSFCTKTTFGLIRISKALFRRLKKLFGRTKTKI